MLLWPHRHVFVYLLPHEAEFVYKILIISIKLNEFNQECLFDVHLHGGKFVYLLDQDLEDWPCLLQLIDAQSVKQESDEHL